MVVLTTNLKTVKHRQHTSISSSSEEEATGTTVVTTTKAERKAERKRLKRMQRENETKEERKARKAAKRDRKKLKRKRDNDEPAPLNTEITQQFVEKRIKLLHQENELKKKLQESKNITTTLSPTEFRKENNMTIVGKDENGIHQYTCPPPILTFEKAPFERTLLTEFKKSGFSKPSPIQSQAWPICMEGRDIISVARTGSGKTLGFLLPTFAQIKRVQGLPDKQGQDYMYNKTLSYSNNKNYTPNICKPIAVVLAPTRELAMQIDVEASHYGKAQGLNSVCIYGGQSKWFQISQMQKKKPQIIIATPGRLNDLCNINKISLQNVAVLVLDEADRMLDMGFEPQLEEIRSHMSPQVAPRLRPLPSSGKCDHFSRQTMMFTATWPKSVERIASSLLHNPVQINVGNVGVLVANEDVTQKIIVLDESDKREKLLEILKSLPKDNKTIVFTMMKSTCDRTANHLWNLGFNCDAIHGDKEQRDRTKIMARFKSSEVPLLFATDVAARGLDVKDITHVINYDFPRAKGKGGIEDFVHRIGRTGRAGAKGTAVTFFTKENKGNARQLCELLKRAKQDVPPELEALIQRGWKRNGGGNSGRGRNGGRGSRGYNGGNRRSGGGGRMGGRARGRGGWSSR
jgi:ATP-dependent RNA helicase DDX5/DBP2